MSRSILGSPKAARCSRLVTIPVGYLKYVDFREQVEVERAKSGE